MAMVIGEAVEDKYDVLWEIMDQVDERHREKLASRFKAAEGPAWMTSRG